jgi:hypothetical protein
MKKFINTNWFMFFSMCLLFVSSCGGSGSSSTTSSSSTSVELAGLASCTAQSGSAVICGSVFAADGTTPVVGATISRVSSNSSLSLLTSLTGDGHGNLVADTTTCVTDDAGAFACEDSGCTDGESTSYQASSSLFGTAISFSVSCAEDEATTVAVTETTAGADQSAGVKWLVIPGSYDGIQLLLSDLKGCTLTGSSSSPASMTSSTECETAGLTVLDSSDVSTFLSTETLSEYQAIFANCDADYGDDGDITSALQTYVEAGGNMYFSDLADSWLTSDFPNLVTFPSNKNSTSAGTLSDATVVDTGLQVFLGSSSSPQATMEIEFDLGVWTAMEEVISTWTTYIQSDVSSLASSLTGTRPITVGGPNADGCIFYTSYHVEGAVTGSDQENALKYLVLNRMNNCD